MTITRYTWALVLSYVYDVHGGWTKNLSILTQAKRQPPVDKSKYLKHLFGSKHWNIGQTKRWPCVKAGLGYLFSHPPPPTTTTQLYLEAIMLYNIAICSACWFKSRLMWHRQPYSMQMSRLNISKRAQLMGALTRYILISFPFCQWYTWYYLTTV